MSARLPAFELVRQAAASSGQGAGGLVLLHGFLGSPATWREVVSALPGHLPVALAWLPGHGPAPWTSPGDFIQTADAIADAIPFAARVWIVGYSLGGRLALTMALRRPDRIAGAVLVGAHPGLRDERERRARMERDALQAERLVVGGLPAFVAAWEALPLFASQAALPEAVRAEQRAARCTHDPPSVADALRRLGLGAMPPLWDALPSAVARLRFVAGALDAKFVALAREAADRTTKADAVVIPGAGHNVALEAPLALAQTITEVMAR